MKWIDKLRGAFKRSADSSSSGRGSVVVRSAYQPIVNSPSEALALDTVYRCVDILSGTVASLPMELQRKRGEVYELDAHDGLNYLFERSANERQTFCDLMRNAIISYLLRGNAYIYPMLDDAGDIVALYLLNSDAVSYDVQSNRYLVSSTQAGVTGTLRADELIHLRNKSLDGGYIGVSTIAYAARTLAISANADNETLEGFRGGNKLKGVISGGSVREGFGALSDNVVDEVAKRFEDELDAGKNIIRLPGTVQFSPLSITPQDAQLLETRKFSAFSVCRFFGVHPDMVFVDSGSGNYKASENSQITFLNQTLRPLIKQIQAEFSAKLIRGSWAIQLKRRIVFNLGDLYLGDLKTRAEYYKTSVEAGIMTPNEVRQAEGRQPIEGGDVTFISCNVAPIDSPKIAGLKEPNKLIE